MMTVEKAVVNIYTDGSSLGNPGPGGYGVVMKSGKHRKELSGGFRLTTNNRMELMAVIKGLQALNKRCSVRLFSDSKYVVDSINNGRAKKWRAKGWMRNKKDKALNPDLWGMLLDINDCHDVQYFWVRGHAGDPENERCDWLSRQAALKKGLPPDSGYAK